MLVEKVEEEKEEKEEELSLCTALSVRSQELSSRAVTQPRGIVVE